LRILYRIFVWLYPRAAWLLGRVNPKAALWINGRKKVFRELSSFFHHRQQRAGTIWMHCSSLGEFEQGRPVLESLKSLYPDHTILLSFFSPSGYEVSKNYEGADHICYLPMDRPRHAQRFLNIVQPSLVIFVKYEFWYYYLHEIKEREIPLLLVSGIFRKEQPFFQWYGKFHRQMLQCFSHLFVQEHASLQLLQQIGLEKQSSLGGDTRFDRVLEIAGRFQAIPIADAFCKGHQVIVAGSTWTEDDEALDHFVHTHPEIRFIIAPHHIDEDRLQECERLYQHTIRYSELQEGKQVKPEQRVLLIDNMGMLSRLYHYATVAYIGGGFGKEGIHNTLEAAVFGTPLVFGPIYERYTEAIGLIDAGAAFPVPDALHLENTLKDLLSNEATWSLAAKAAQQFVHEHAGASEKVISYIQENRLLTI
jgi:3-deoxy-D-manno-octulosonic-acid transferase